MRLPNNYGNVSKLPGNRRKPYRARVTTGWIDLEDGKRRQQFKTIGYYETKEEGLIALANYHQNPYDLETSKITFSELYEKWSAEHFPKVSQSNVYGYIAAYKLCEPLYSMRFVDIKRSHLQGVVDNCGKNYPTLRKLRSFLGVLYKYGMQNDVVTKDYSQYIDISQYNDRNPNQHEKKPFTKEEIEIVWKWKDSSEYTSVILMLIYSGVRIGELRNLKKENVNIPERWFDIVASKTAAGIRKVPIAEKIVPFFEYWMNKNDSEYLISTPEGSQVTDHYLRKYFWTPLIDQMGMQHDPHEARHTCVSLLTSAGVKDKVIRKIVGHAGQSITESVYTHFEIQELIDAINRI